MCSVLTAIGEEWAGWSGRGEGGEVGLVVG